MAVDTAQKRAMALNVGVNFSDLTMPWPNDEERIVDDMEQVHLLHGYYLFEPYQWDSRHRRALLRLFPVKGLITDE